MVPWWPKSRKQRLKEEELARALDAAQAANVASKDLETFARTWEAVRSATLAVRLNGGGFDVEFEARSEACLTRIARIALADATPGRARDGVVREIRQIWSAAHFGVVALENITSKDISDRDYARMRRQYAQVRLEHIYGREEILAQRLVAYCEGAGHDPRELREFLTWIDREVSSRIPQ
jgi:hypothetical protein